MNGLLNLTGSVVGKPEVVEGGVVEGVEADGFEVILDGFSVVIFVTITISNVIVAFYLFGIQMQRLLVIDDCFLGFLKQIERICQIVVDIGDLVIELDGALVVLNGLLWFSDIIQSVCETNQCLKFFWIVNE